MWITHKLSISDRRAFRVVGDICDNFHQDAWPVYAEVSLAGETERVYSQKLLMKWVSNNNSLKLNDFVSWSLLKAVTHVCLSEQMCSTIFFLTGRPS